MTSRGAAFRSLTSKPFGANFFTAPPAPRAASRCDARGHYPDGHARLGREPFAAAGASRRLRGTSAALAARGRSLARADSRVARSAGAGRRRRCGGARLRPHARRRRRLHTHGEVEPLARKERPAHYAGAATVTAPADITFQFCTQVSLAGHDVDGGALKEKVSGGSAIPSSSPAPASASTHTSTRARPSWSTRPRRRSSAAGSDRLGGGAGPSSSWASPVWR